MTDATLRVLERVHGHLGWLAAAALIHPVIVLRSPARRAVLATTLATALITAGAALGLVVYPAYRTRLKQSIFLDAPRLGWMFERKEHLAFAAVALAWAGLCAHLGSGRTADAAARASLWRAARWAYAAAAALAIAVGAIGVAVAAHRSFG